MLTWKILKLRKLEDKCNTYEYLKKNVSKQTDKLEVKTGTLVLLQWEASGDRVFIEKGLKWKRKNVATHPESGMVRQCVTLSIAINL